MSTTGHLFPHTISQKCFLFLPWNSSSSLASPGDLLFILTLEFTSSSPGIAWLGQASPSHWQSQPVSLEKNSPCLLCSPHGPVGEGRTLLLPLWRCVVWECGRVVAWWWPWLKASHVSGVALGRRLSGNCFLYSPLPRSKSSMFLQQALPFHVWYSERVNISECYSELHSL